MTVRSERRAVVQEKAVRSLRSQVRGRLIGPSDSDYDEVRQVWNGTVDRRPGLIVRCAEVADVVTAVNFAREHDLLVAVRGGGHNAAGAR